MTSKEKKLKAQDLIMQHLSTIGYGSDFEEFAKLVGNEEEATKILFQQMNRVAKLCGYDSAWFS